MTGIRARIVPALLVPAAVFQSVIFGGAYGTGREIAEFVTRHGPWGGLLSLAVIGIAFGAVLALSFELARVFRLYDYRNFLMGLIGGAWWLYEVLFLIALLLVLAVNGSAAGNILESQLGIPQLAGIAVLFLAVVLLNFFGRQLLEKSMSFWMIALSAVLLVFCGLTLLHRGDLVAQAFAQSPATGSWMVSGLQYAFYNVAVVPVLLFCARGIETRGEAVAGGLLAGAMGAFPALIFHITFMAGYPEVLVEALPTYWMIGQLAMPWLMLAYVIVLFGMIIQTLAGLLHGLNERVDAWFQERRGRICSRRTHAAIAAGILLLSLLLSRIGITALVAEGYGNLAWGYLLVFILPLFTIGVYRLAKASARVPSPT